jgi:hypothetical protein
MNPILLKKRSKKFLKLTLKCLQPNRKNWLSKVKIVLVKEPLGLFSVKARESREIKGVD